MNKTVALKLRNFRPIPPGLQSQTNARRPANQLRVSLPDLFHHLYLDSYGRTPPTPNPFNYLYPPMLARGTALRFLRDGLGSHKEARIGEHNKFGKAFCRWFLSCHCDIHHFAHMDQVLNDGFAHRLGPIQVTRAAKGDTPDYLCSRNNRNLFLAEAKGTSSAISFDTTKFDSWRQQFRRVRCTHRNGRIRRLKGYIVATRLATENDSPNARSTVLAEDPETEGDAPLDEQDAGEMAQAVVCAYYADILDHLRQPLLAAVLRSGDVLPSETKVRIAIWEGLAAPARGLRFVGGYYPPPGRSCEDVIWWPQPQLSIPAPICLSAAEATFFGLELNTFKQLHSIALRGRSGAPEVQLPSLEGHSIPGLSVLRAGTALASLNFFRFLEAAEF